MTGRRSLLLKDSRGIPHVLRQSRKEFQAYLFSAKPFRIPSASFSTPFHTYNEPFSLTYKNISGWVCHPSYISYLTSFSVTIFTLPGSPIYSEFGLMESRLSTTQFSITTLSPICTSFKMILFLMVTLLPT